MSNNSSRVQSAHGERAAGTCQSALYPHYRWLKMDKDRTAHAYLRACTNGIVKRPLDFQTSAVARRLRRSCSKCSRETREIGDQRVPLEFLRGEANSPSLLYWLASKTLQLCWCKKGPLNVWSTFRFLATWRTRLDPSFTGSGGSSAIAINWRRAQTRAQSSFDDSGVSSNFVLTNKTLTPFLGLPGARWPMRSSVADSRGEVSTEEILPGCGDGNGDAHKRNPWCGHSFPEHVCQAESGCVMSCNLAAGATEV